LGAGSGQIWSELCPSGAQELLSERHAIKKLLRSVNPSEDDVAKRASSVNKGEPTSKVVPPSGIGNGGEIHQVAGGDVPILTTQQGIPVSDDQNSLRVGAR
jgi:hypothetical protein